MPIEVTTAGRASAALISNQYGSTNVTTGAYVQLLAAMPVNGRIAQIFDSSGSALKIAFGSPGSEVDQFFIPPGGYPEPVQFFFPKGVRISIKAVDVNATSGQLLMTVLT